MIATSYKSVYMKYSSTIKKGKSKAVPVHATKAYRGGEIQLQSFLISTPDRC